MTLGLELAFTAVEVDRGELDRAAVVLADDEFVGDVDQLAGQVTGVRGTESRIGTTLAGTVGGAEVLEDDQSLPEVGPDRYFDGLPRRLGHQAAHPGKLHDLLRAATGTGLSHDEQRVERHVVLEVTEHRLLHLLGRFAPQPDDGREPLFLGGEAFVEQRFDRLQLLLGSVDQLPLLRRDRHVIDTDGDAGRGGQFEARVLEAVEQPGCPFDAEQLEAVHHQVAERVLLVGDVVTDHGHRYAATVLGQGLAHQPGEVDAARTGLHQLAVQPDGDGVLHVDLTALNGQQGLVLVSENVAEAAGGRLLAVDDDRAVQVDDAGVECLEGRRGVSELRAGAAVTGVRLGEYEQAEDDVTAGLHVRVAVRGRQQVVAGQHLQARFALGVHRQRHVDGHLVTVEVSVERLTDERVQLDGLAFDQYRLERLDAEAVQRRGTVQQDDAVLDDLFEGVPDLVARVAVAFQHLAGALDVVGDAALLKLLEQERLEQFQRHALGYPALVKLELRSDHDDTTAGVIHPLAEQVLAEAALLATEQVGQAAQRAVGTGVHDRAAAAAVVDECIDCLLQHALLVAHDHLGRTLLDQLLQPVVAVDEPAVQVVQVTRREPATLDLNHGPQVGRHDRDDVKHHPGGLVAALDEAADDLKPLAGLGALVAAGAFHLSDEFFLEHLQVDGLEQLPDRFRAHLGVEVVALDEPHLVTDQVDLDAATDVSFDAAAVSKLVTRYDAVAVDDDRFILVRVDLGAGDDDACRFTQVDRAVSCRDDLLGGVDGADDLLAGLNGRSVTDEHVHRRVDLVDLAALPADGEGDRDLTAAYLAGPHRGAGRLGQAERGAGRSSGQFITGVDQVAAADAGYDTGRQQVAGEDVLVILFIADVDHTTVSTDRQQFRDAAFGRRQHEVVLELSQRLAALLLFLFDPAATGKHETRLTALLVIEGDLAREAVLRDAVQFRLDALGELLAGLDSLAITDYRIFALLDGVGLLVAVAQLAVLVVGEQVATLERAPFLEGSLRIRDDVLAEVQHLFKLAG